MKNLMISLAVGLLIIATPSFAQESTDVLAREVASQQSAELSIFQIKAQARLAAANKGYAITDVKLSGIDGFYRVKLNGQILYMSSDTDYFFTGDLLKFEDNAITNLSTISETADRIALMSELKPAEMIVFSPLDPLEIKAHITVFTDIDCGFCRKLHQEVSELNAMGVEVRYMGFPRAGIGSASYNKYVSAWCAADQQDSLTKLKNNKSIETKTCENPIEAQYALGQKMGVTATPAILFSDGTVILGYRKAKDLALRLGL